jgi:DNA replication protein DnaC
MVKCDAPGCLQDTWHAYRQGADFLRKVGVSRPTQTFETFKVNAETQEAYEAVKAFAEGTANFCMLLIYGGVGNGKTHLANAAAIYLNQQGQDCRYFVVPDLLSSLKGAIAQGEDIDAQINVIREYANLILDDYKPSLETPFDQDTIEQIITHRYAFLLPTVLITNEPWDALPERIVSRFKEPGIGRVVYNRGNDYRAR